MNFKGTIIEESLEDKSVLKDVKILSTRVEPIEKSHQTPWLERWTLHRVEIPEESAGKIAEKLSQSFDHKHGGNWYADFKNGKVHYIIFRNKIFKIDRTSKEQYQSATDYGLKLGIPDYQVNFAKNLIKS